MRYILILITVICSGCSLFRTVAAKSQERLAESAVKVFLAEDDYKIAVDSAAASLKTLEALADATPESDLILLLTARSFFMYSFTFVEEESPERASKLYLRGLNWGSRAFTEKDIFFQSDKYEFKEVFSSLKGMQLDCALWSLVNFSCWLNVNRSSIEAAANKYKVKLAADILLPYLAEKYYGMLYILKALDASSVPAALGGDMVSAEKLFRQAVDISGGCYLPARYLFAKYYAVAVQAEDLFSEQISLIKDFDPDLFPEERLANILIKKRAEKLSARREDLFF